MQFGVCGCRWPTRVGNRDRRMASKFLRDEVFLAEAPLSSTLPLAARNEALVSHLPSGCEFLFEAGDPVT